MFWKSEESRDSITDLWDLKSTEKKLLSGCKCRKEHSLLQVSFTLYPPAISLSRRPVHMHFPDLNIALLCAELPGPKASQLLVTLLPYLFLSTSIHKGDFMFVTWLRQLTNKIVMDHRLKCAFQWTFIASHLPTNTERVDAWWIGIETVLWTVMFAWSWAFDLHHHLLSGKSK